MNIKTSGTTQMDGLVDRSYPGIFDSRRNGRTLWSWFDDTHLQDHTLMLALAALAGQKSSTGRRFEHLADTVVGLG
jgi:hypothetical protein